MICTQSHPDLPRKIWEDQKSSFDFELPPTYAVHPALLDPSQMLNLRFH